LFLFVELCSSYAVSYAASIVQDAGFGLWSSKGCGYRKDGVDAEEDDRWFHVGFLFGLAVGE
jgi:hypothetical protein